MSAVLELTREQILAFRRHVGALDNRLPTGTDSLRRAAYAGLQDSMPRAALMSIHARVDGTDSSAWEHEALVQIWGPRYSVYAVARDAVPIFTLSRMPDGEKGRRRAEETADMLERFLEGRRMKDRDIDALVRHPYSLRYATLTGRVLIRWEGALAPYVWTVKRPEMSVTDARLEMARRYVHMFGPTTAESFAEWAGIALKSGLDTFNSLDSELIVADTPIGSGFLLASDESAMRDDQGPAAAARLLPSGDAFFLLWGRDREIVVPDERRRPELWTPRVWPGAMLVNGEVSGVWRRANERFAFQSWRPLSPAEREAVESEAASMPVPGLTRPMSFIWDAS